MNELDCCRHSWLECFLSMHALNSVFKIMLYNFVLRATRYCTWRRRWATPTFCRPFSQRCPPYTPQCTHTSTVHTVPTQVPYLQYIQCTWHTWYTWYMPCSTCSSYSTYSTRSTHVDNTCTCINTNTGVYTGAGSQSGSEQQPAFRYTEYGSTALHLAVASGVSDSVAILLADDASDANLPDQVRNLVIFANIHMVRGTLVRDMVEFAGN